MNYSEMLHDFLDSSLNGSGEETLFRALAADEELRFELKYLLKLRDAVGEDDEAYVVPISSTSAIFAQLGYTAPAALVGAAGGIAGAQSGLWTLLKTGGGYLLASLVGALVTTGIFMWNDGSDEKQLASADRTSAGQVQATQGTPAAASTSAQGGSNQNPSAIGAGSSAMSAGSVQGKKAVIADVSAGKSVATRNSTPPVTVNGGNSAFRNGNGTPTNDESLATTSGKSDENATAVTKQAAAKNEAMTEVSRTDSLSLGVVKEDPLTDPATTKERLTEPMTESRSSDLTTPDPFKLEQPKPWREATFSVSLRKAVVPFELKSPNTTLPETSSGLDNITAGFAYPLPFYRNLSVVAEAGKESYLLTFNEHRSDGRIFQHEVMPSVFWAGIGGRFSLAPQSWLNPFGQVIIGGSEAGMIGRGMLGGQVSLNDQIGMMIGLEYNLAMYRFQGETTASPKLGLNCGLTFNLFGN